MGGRERQFTLRDDRRGAAQPSSAPVPMRVWPGRRGDDHRRRRRVVNTGRRGVIHRGRPVVVGAHVIGLFVRHVARGDDAAAEDQGCQGRGKEDEAFFYAALKNKLAQLPRYDAVLIGDDAALVFAMQHQQELFAQIPMVFLYVNNISLAEQAAKSPWITGIVEKSAYRRNLDLILQLFPGTKNIVAVTDRTLTAQGDQQQFQDCIPEYPNLHFNLINASECTQIELAERIAAVRGNSVLLYLNLFEDKDRNVYTIESGGSFIAAHARVPVFRFSIGALDNGILGGIMISFEESGRQAGSMVREILQQEICQ